VNPSGKLCSRMAMKMIQPSQVESTKPEAIDYTQNSE